MAESEYIVDGNNAVEFKLVKTPEQLHNDSQTFKPMMCHQIFGDEESIFGFKDLKIKLYYTAGSLEVFCGFEYGDKLPEYEVSDIMKKIKTKYEFPLYENIQDYEMILRSENFSPCGTLLTDYKFEDVKGEKKEIEVYYSTNTVPGFVSFHQRLQTFVLWFIDAASYIDIDDCGWNFFTVYEKYYYENKVRYAVVGYATVYDYYAYPEHIRPRISQVLILPPYQSKGLCAKLLSVIYEYYLANKKNILDFTVEDPSEDFQRVRDFVDCQRVINHKILVQNQLQREFREDLIKDMHKICKLNKRQARRVYEILRLKNLNKLDDQIYLDYRIEVKRRLNQPFYKQMKLISKCKNGMTPQEVQENIISDEERKARLDLIYLQVVEQYSAVVKRLQESEKLT